MKVLLIHQSFVSPEEAGGTRHYEFATFCAQHGVEFTIVASNISYLTGKLVAEPRGMVFRENVGVVKVLRARTIAAVQQRAKRKTPEILEVLFPLPNPWNLRANQPRQKLP